MFVGMRLGQDQREIVLLVAPLAKRRPATGAQHQPGIAQTELVTILDMDTLATSQAALSS